MFWLLEHDLFSESNFLNLVSTLERFDVEHAIVRRYKGILVPEIDLSGKLVYVCGSTGLGRVAKERGWVPGYFDENLDYRNVMRHYGENCLNHRGFVTTLRDIDEPPCDGARFFVRPTSDKKTFGGKVFDWETFDSWRKSVIALENSGGNTMTTLKSSDTIVIAPLTKIYAEYRFFVIDGVIVTGSLYKRGTQVYYQNVDSGAADEELMSFARAMIDTASPNSQGWQPNRAFTLDVALTSEGYKVIEINAINSSGFYACDMAKYVFAINAMTF